MALAACGTASGADTTDGVASLQEEDAATDTTAASEDPETPTDPEEAFALFEECMADHGIDMGEGAIRTSDGGVAIQRGESESESNSSFGGSQGEGIEVDPEEFRAADEECSHHLDNLDDGFELTPEQEAAMEDARLAFQECMKEHGVEGDFMVAVGNGGGASFSSEVDERTESDPQAQSELDPEELDKAHEECIKIFEETPELEGLFGEGEGPGRGPSFGGPDE